MEKTNHIKLPNTNVDHNNSIQYPNNDERKEIFFILKSFVSNSNQQPGIFEHYKHISNIVELVENIKTKLLLIALDNICDSDIKSIDIGDTIIKNLHWIKEAPVGPITNYNYKLSTWESIDTKLTSKEKTNRYDAWFELLHLLYNDRYLLKIPSVLSITNLSFQLYWFADVYGYQRHFQHSLSPNIVKQLLFKGYDAIHYNSNYEAINIQYQLNAFYSEQNINKNKTKLLTSPHIGYVCIMYHLCKSVEMDILILLKDLLSFLTVDIIQLLIRFMIDFSVIDLYKDILTKDMYILHLFNGLLKMSDSQRDWCILNILNSRFYDKLSCTQYRELYNIVKEKEYKAWLMRVSFDSQEFLIRLFHQLYLYEYIGEYLSMINSDILIEKNLINIFCDKYKINSSQGFQELSLFPICKYLLIKWFDILIDNNLLNINICYKCGVIKKCILYLLCAKNITNSMTKYDNFANKLMKWIFEECNKLDDNGILTNKYKLLCNPSQYKHLFNSYSNRMDKEMQSFFLKCSTFD